MRLNYKIILRTISIILLIVGIAMLFPMVCAVYMEEYVPAQGFFFSSICCIGLGALGRRFSNYNTIRIKSAESYLITFISWLTVCITGVVPYMLSGCGYTLSDAILESVSGWTTTYASVFDIATLPVSVVLWKSITNWLGGMGLLLLAVSFFSVLGAEGQKIANAEVSGTAFEKLSSKTNQTISISYMVYIAMTSVEFLLLLPTDLSFIEALINTLSTISTAGFLNVNNCIVLHLTSYTKIIFAGFSVVGAINLLMFYYLFTGKWRKVVSNVELKYFLLLIIVGGTIITASLYMHGDYSFLKCMENGFAQAIGYSSTSGFYVDDLNQWPTIAKLVLMILVICGGCGNSTSGSIKVIRAIIFVKLIKRGIFKRIHPRAVKPVMLNDSPVSTTTASNVTVFILMYFAVFVVGSIILSLENQDMETTFFTTLACITNNGTGFGKIINGDYSIFSAFGRSFAAFLMLAGRLEFYAIIMLFSPSFWNSDRVHS